MNLLARFKLLAFVHSYSFRNNIWVFLAIKCLGMFIRERDSSKYPLLLLVSNYSRYTRLQDSETETNPIDRTVAHFLFHRPSESPVKHCEPSESPRSSKLQSKDKVQSIVTEAELDLCKDSPCAAATSENASSIGLTDGGAVVESSQWTEIRYLFTP